MFASPRLKMHRTEEKNLKMDEDEATAEVKRCMIRLGERIGKFLRVVKSKMPMATLDFCTLRT